MHNCPKPGHLPAVFYMFESLSMLKNNRVNLVSNPILVSFF